MVSGPRVKTDAGPVTRWSWATCWGGTQADLAVANSGADNVQVFPGVGGGFFNDQAQATRTYAVGQGPNRRCSWAISAGRGLGLATLNAGSNDGTLISLAGTSNPVIQSLLDPAAIRRPPASSGDFTRDGFTDLVVGNNGDGHLALLLGGSGGLSLSQTLVSAEAPNPTSLSFAGVSDGELNFYGSAMAGREAAIDLAFNLSGGAGLEAGLSARGRRACRRIVPGRRFVAGHNRLNPAGIAAPELLGHHAGPGRHVADGPRCCRGTWRASRAGRWRRSGRPGSASPWSSPGPGAARAVPTISPVRRQGLTRRDPPAPSKRSRRGSGCRSAWNGRGNGAGRGQSCPELPERGGVAGPGARTGRAREAVAVRPGRAHAGTNRQ